MSRIGKKPIPVPSGVEVSTPAGEVVIKGKGGELRKALHPSIQIVIENGAVVVTPKHKTRLARALWGTYASHVKNMMQGVSTPFRKVLQIEGIGYRAELSGKNLKLSVGFSHPVMVEVPDGITAAVDKNLITVTGPDKEKVGQFAANIRAVKKPEPYKGKGIRYEGEVVRQKAGKKAV